MGVMASQITSLTIVYSTVYSGADQRKHQSSASLAFVRTNSPVTGEFPAQMASNAENFSIWWHHIVCSDVCNPFEGREPVNGIYGWLSSNELSVMAAMAICHIRFQWAIIGSDNGMWIVWRQDVTWITDDLLSIILFGTQFSEILIKIKLFYWRKWIWKWWPFCLGLNVHQQSQCCKIQ